MLGRGHTSSQREALSMRARKRQPLRRSGQDRIGVVTRVEGDYAFVRWTHSNLAEIEEYQAYRDDVTPLAGWLLRARLTHLRHGLRML